MKNKIYLPVWTDGLTYDEQHFVFWIANNAERVDERYSFLPIRIPGNFFCERMRFNNYIHLIDNYFEKGICRTCSQVVPLAYYVAEKAFDSAADVFFEKYPYACNITFGELNSNGLYNMKFDMDYVSRLEAFQRILDEKIEEFCVVDEIFEYKEEEKTNHSIWPEYSIKALIDIKKADIYYNFPKILSSHGFPYVPKKQVRIKKEDVYEYYLTVPEKIFVLGNQYVKYNQNSEELREFFEAAKERDLTAIKNYVKLGADINAIDSDGTTVFCKFIGDFFADEKDKCAIDDLKQLIHLGANPAIYGAGFDEDPLSNACLYEYLDVVQLMLESGVNPHSFPCIDEPSEIISESLLERTERWAKGDINIDNTPSEAQQRILEMLMKYM